MTREECDTLLLELEQRLLTQVGNAERGLRRDMGHAAAATESRLKIWAFAGLLTLIALLFSLGIYGFSDLGSYRERVDQNYRRIDRLEQKVYDPERRGL